MDQQVTPGAGPALGAAGPCPAIDYAGKSWAVGHPTQRAKAELELLVIDAAQRNIDQRKGRLSKDQYEAKCAALDLQVQGGHHRTWGPLWRAVNAGPDGTKLFLLSLLREHQPDATFADVDGMFRDAGRQTTRALAVVMPIFFSLLVTEMPVGPEERAAKLADLLTEYAAQTPSEPTA